MLQYWQLPTRLTMIKKLLLSLLSIFLFPTIVLASIGVGVGTGKIEVTEKLKPGIVYKLPSVTVLNTGDTPSNYSIDIAYNETQSELKPDKSWFTFSPLNFHLDPGGVQKVDITLTVPLKITPGKYFAYIEGFPVRVPGIGSVVGVAAASKLYFEVVTSNPIAGLYYRIISLAKFYSPWPERIFGILGVIIVLYFIKRFLRIEVGLKKKEKMDE